MKSKNIFQNVQKIRGTKAALKAQRTKLIPNEVEDLYDAKFKDITSEDIEKMTALQILDLNIIDENAVLIDTPDFESDEECIEYLRSVFVFLKKSDEMIESLDKSTAELDAIMEESNRELSAALLDMGETNVVCLIDKSIKKAIEKATDPKEIAELTKKQEAFEDSYKLRRLIDLYKRISSDNLKEDAEKHAAEVYKRYVKTNMELGLTFDLTRIKDFEVKYLPEEYHEMNNMFIFTCIKYIGKLTKIRGAKTTEDGVFASQLTTNLYLLEEGKLPDEYKDTLIESVKTLLDIIK